MLMSYAWFVRYQYWANVRSCYCLLPLASFQKANNYVKVKIGRGLESVMYPTNSFLWLILKFSKALRWGHFPSVLKRYTGALWVQAHWASCLTLGLEFTFACLARNESRFLFWVSKLHGSVSIFQEQPVTIRTAFEKWKVCGFVLI